MEYAFNPYPLKGSECATLVAGQPYKILEEQYTYGPNTLTPTKTWSPRTSIAGRMPLFQKQTNKIISSIHRRKHSLCISISTHQINNPLINHKCLKRVREIQLNYIRERFSFEEYRRSNRSKDAEANVDLLVEEM